MNMEFRKKEYKPFDIFDSEWAAITVGNREKFNACLVSWSSLGNIWGAPGKSKATVTLYIHPSRYTAEFIDDSEYFTVSFFDPKYKKALAYLGSHSGRNENKIENAGLMAIPIGKTMGFKEAKQIFLCKKLCKQQFDKESFVQEIRDYYELYPDIYTDGHGGWEPHFILIGEIEQIID